MLTLHTLCRILIKRHLLLLYIVIAPTLACARWWVEGEGSYSSVTIQFIENMPTEADVSLIPPTRAIATPAAWSCDELRLTSPLDGLPNGVATFYWDPLPDASSYTVSLYDSGALLAGFGADGSATNLSADVSQRAIGGLYRITMILTAVGPNGSTCTTSANVFREAPTLQDTIASIERPTVPPAVGECRWDGGILYCH